MLHCLQLFGGGSGTGLAIFPSDETAPDARAIHIATADNSRENFFVEMSGKLFARSRVQTEGGVLARNLDAFQPVFQANAGAQAAFLASVQTTNAIAFLAKPATETIGGSAFVVQTVQGQDVSHIDMSGAASFASLAVGGKPVEPQLRATSSPFGGKPLAAGTCESSSLSVPGAAVSMAVSVSASGGVDPGDGFFVRGYVSGPGTVIIQLCNMGVEKITPLLTSYNIRVEP